MKKMISLLVLFAFHVEAYSQLPMAMRIDSIIQINDNQKLLKTEMVCDSFPVAHSEMFVIECYRFYSIKNKLVKAIFSSQYHHRDTTRKDAPTQLDVYYYYNDLLIKVVSKDFDQTPPVDLKFYFGEQDRKKYLIKETIRAGKYDGVNYFIETGYMMLDEFKYLFQNKSR